MALHFVSYPLNFYLLPFFVSFRLWKMWGSLSIKQWSLWKRGSLDSMKNYIRYPKTLKSMTKIKEESRMTAALRHQHLQGGWFGESMIPSWMGVSVIVRCRGERSTVGNLDIRVERVVEKAVAIKPTVATRLGAIGGLPKSNEYLRGQFDKVARFLRLTCLALSCDVFCGRNCLLCVLRLAFITWPMLMSCVEIYCISFSIRWNDDVHVPLL